MAPKMFQEVIILIKLIQSNNHTSTHVHMFQSLDYIELAVKLLKETNTLNVRSFPMSQIFLYTFLLVYGILNVVSTCM